MKIVVCLKEVVDPALSLDFGLTSSVVLREGLPLGLNPDDAAALSLALGLRSPERREPVEITLVSIGEQRVESYLRNGLALGADKAVRIWESGFAGLSSFTRAMLLSRAAGLFNADLVFTGAASLDTGNAQVGPLMAVWLDMPCVTGVVSLELAGEQDSLELTRDIGRGERERVRCPLPAVITVKGDGRLPYASLDRFVESRYADITLLSLPDLGITPGELKDDPTQTTGLTFPRPGPRKAPPLDSSLPAFYRILQLLEGGISKRQGTVLEGSSDELAERLYELFLADGVIQPAGEKGAADK